MAPELIEAAVAYGSLGWHVVPVLGKVPQGSAWQTKATTSPTAELFAGADGVGVLLGEVSGLVDVECDSEEATDTLFSLLRGEIPETPTFASTRGKHYLFRWRDGLPEKAVFKINGLEFRVGNESAQSVFPPSPGRTWEIDPTVPVIDFPAWDEVLILLSEIKKPKRFAKRAGFITPTYGDGSTLNVPRWLEKHGREIVGQDTGHDGATRWFIECPGIALHTGPNAWKDCCVTQEPDGRLGGHCFHQSCGMSDWDALRDSIGSLEWEDYQEPIVGPSVDLSGILSPKQTASVPTPKPHDDPFPASVFRVPGIIKLFVDYCAATAPRFIPEAALASAISIVSVLSGRKVRSRSGMRTNVYTILLAPSGSGKDWPRGRCRDCFELAGLADFLGAEKFASDAGLISQIQANPAVLFQIDEVNRYFATINAAGVKTSHLSGIFSTLMELHGLAGTASWTPKGYGDAKNNKTISFPHCALFCTGVPDGFWSAIKSTDTTDGFLSRMLVIETNATPRKRNIELVSPPGELIRLMQAWGEFQAGSGNLKSVNPEALVMPFDSAALARLYEHSESIEDRLEREQSYHRAIWSRASANAEKLAMIFAASRGPSEMIVTRDDADQAVRLANWCARLLIRRIYSHVSETPAEASKKRVLEIIRRHGPMSRSELTNKTQFLRDKRERDSLLMDLQEAELVLSEVVSGEGRSKQVYRCL